jgi:glycosyltransferase involved in cell wall biosynthesis
MIVKNESAILERCLRAAAPHIDCYVICDTGSTDNTVEIIRSFFAGQRIPGEIVTTPFESFEQARNFALDAARASQLDFDYLLLCDADMELVVDRPDFRDELDDSPYFVYQQNVIDGVMFTNLRLLPRDLPAAYRGVTHEYLHIAPAHAPIFEAISFRDYTQGENRPDKFERDVRLLESGLRAEPDNARYVFYLANTYLEGGEPAKAIKLYEQRITMGGFAEEVFYSSYRIGRCLQQLGRESEMIERDLRTFDTFPHRAEPLHALALFYQRQDRHRLAAMLAETGLSIHLPEDGLFVESSVYKWRLLDILAVSKYWLGEYREGAEIARRLLEIVPENQLDRIRSNLKFCEDGIRRTEDIL